MNLLPFNLVSLQSSKRDSVTLTHLLRSLAQPTSPQTKGVGRCSLASFFLIVRLVDTGVDFSSCYIQTVFIARFDKGVMYFCDIPVEKTKDCCLLEGFFVFVAIL